MKEIEGFVCTAKFVKPAKQERLFGPNTGRSEFSHESFTSNGLVPFADLSSAIKSMGDLKKRKDLDNPKVGLAEIKLRIAMFDDEIEQFRDSKNLIIIGDLDGGYKILLGRPVENIPGVCHAPVSDLEMNGFKTIKKLEDATDPFIGALHEIGRQGRLTSHLATFNFKRLKLK
jgi:hypothetical protein